MIEETELRELIREYCRTEFQKAKKEWAEVNINEFRKILDEVRYTGNYELLKQAIRRLHSGAFVLQYHFKSIADLENLWQNFLKEIVETRPEELLENIDERFEKWKKIKGVGKGLISEALAFYYPNYFVPWNNVVDWYFQELGWGKPTKYSEVLSRLRGLREIFEEECSDENVDFVIVDHFGWWLQVKVATKNLSKRLASLLKERKMAHKEEWILKEKEFREYLQKIKELAKKGDSITEEEFKELLNTVNKIRDLLDREVLWLWGSAKAPVEVAHEILSRSDFRELMEIVEEINDIKEIEIDQEIFERILQVMSAPHTKLSTLSSWLFVFNPRVFFPINSYVMNEEALKRLELDKFWVVQKYNKKKLRKVTEEYLRFLSALNIAIEEAEVEDMSEALFYFTKGTGPKGKSITLKRYFDSRGYSYPPHLVSQFYVALKTKGFVILSGLTGTGKTKIAQELAKLLDPSQENFLFLPVRPDWRDSKALLGYYNPLTGEYPRTKLLNFILKAVEDYQNNGVNAKPYFVLLDEMNLAHVEYYFADFLSVLESGREENGFTRESIKLHDNSEVETFEGIPRELKLPPNLYIIGTVNMDETTYAFSPKVLDRAFVVEFHDVDLKNYPPGEDKISQEELEKIRESILNDLRRGGKFLAVRKKGEDGQEKGDIEEALEKLKNANSGKYWQILPKLNKVLEPYDFHFGYRVVDEIALFFENSKESQKNGIIDFRGEDEIFDLALLMKVLPKFHGNRKKLEKPLLIVLKLAKDGELEGTEYQLKTEDLFKMLFEEDKATKKLGAVVEKMGNIEDYKFKHTAKKVLRMLRQLYEIGFASFS